MKRAVALAATLTALAASAGPFGYEMGQKIEGEERNDLGYRSSTRNAPAPFGELTLTYMPNAGLCRIYANLDSKIKRDEAAAERWRRGIVAALTDKYGEPNEINDYSTEWKETPGLGADNLARIVVETGYPTTVYYQFTNSGDCWAERRAEREAEAKADAEADAEALRGLLF